MPGSSLPIATWNLRATNDQPPSAEESIVLNYTPGSGEAVFDDKRKVVQPADIKPGGKYRSIVKLFIRYKGDEARQAIGSGWLIAPDLLVTAGHCTYDWSLKLGAAVEIKAYIGYDGAASVNTPNVQFRHGVKVATTAGWLKGKGHKDDDIGFVKLDKPFTGVTPFKWENTPLGGALMLGVVGYPGDKAFQGEKGAQMYEMYLPTHFDRTRSDLKMLDYVISTFGGQSGSPVLKREGTRLTPIGVHTYGGAAVNSATVIGNEENFGNPIQEYAALFDTGAVLTPVNIVGPIPAGISVVRVTKGSAAITSAVSSEPMEEEGFFDFVKSAMRTVLPMGKEVMSVGLPLALGPIGGPLSSLLNVALDGAARLAESEFVGAESLSTDPASTSSPGAVERAIVAEAALTAILKVDPETLEESGALDVMKRVVATNGALVKKVSPHVMNAILEPGFRMALDNIREQSLPAIVTDFQERVPLPGAEAFTAESGLNDPMDDFILGLTTPAVVVEEGFFDDMFGVIKKGAKFAAPFITGLARKGLDKIDEVVSNKTEAGLEEGPGSTAIMFEQLSHRAVLAEAALQAIVKIPHDVLNEQHPIEGAESEDETESLFDVMKNIIQKIGPKVIQAAPHVISAVGPIVKTLLGGQESFTAVPEPAPQAAPKTTLKAPPPPQKIIRKPSLLDMLNGKQSARNDATGVISVRA